MAQNASNDILDMAIIGAGFTGLYMLHSARDKLGMNARVIDAGDGVGGTWYWNRYPGARCDSPSHIYCYSFDPELTDEWEWSERYPEQREILSYLEHVAERHDLYKDIDFGHFISSCAYDEEEELWKLTSSAGKTYKARFVVCGTGSLTASNMPIIKGRDTFKGKSFHTSRWPEGGVDFTAKKVAVIGTGATGVQCIPLISLQAKKLVVFQRTATYCIPARNGKVDPEVVAKQKERKGEIRTEIQNSFFGFDVHFLEKSIFEATPEERKREFDRMWDQGGFGYWLGNYKEMFFSEDANQIVSDYVRDKIRNIVFDPETAEKLVPKYGFGTKRSPLETNYYDTFNKETVRLVDAKTDGGIEEITPTGIVAGGKHYEVDIIVYATGFDAMTGALKKMNIVGRDGVALNDVWQDGPETYLGLMTTGFPNLFMVTGPQSPAAFSNVPVSIEQHVEFITQCLRDMEASGLTYIEPEAEAQEAWSTHLQELVDQTILQKTDSWYLGANVEGKPRRFMVYLGPEGVGGYRRTCEEIVADDYRGFKRAPNAAAA